MTSAREWGVRLKALRKSKGLTQEEVGARGGVSHTSLSKMENGEYFNPRQATIEALAKGLSMPVNEFMDTVFGGNPAAYRKTPDEIAYELYSQLREAQSIKLADVYEVRGGELSMTGNRVPYAPMNGVQGDMAVKGAALPFVRGESVLIVNSEYYENHSMTHGDAVLFKSDGKVAAGYVRMAASPEQIVTTTGTHRLKECEIIGHIDLIEHQADRPELE